MIVVAIDNDGADRMHEYAAWKFSEMGIPGCSLVVREPCMPNL